ncbi:Mitotic spindle assembly checkpoint protein MAD1, partial [Pseudolycoriella hygida]
KVLEKSNAPVIHLLFTGDVGSGHFRLLIPCEGSSCEHIPPGSYKLLEHHTSSRITTISTANFNESNIDSICEPEQSDDPPALDTSFEDFIILLAKCWVDKDNFARSEITVSDMQLRLRLDMLEKTVAGYKDMCTNLEKELQTAKSSPEHVEPFTNEQYKKIRKEMDSLKDENERLRRRKDELEMLYEHSNMKDAFNIPKYKVMHMAVNPADQAYENNKNEIEKLQAEIERLKRKNRKLETEHEEFTAANLTFDIKELNNLRAQIIKHVR